jgi:predicted ribosome quality control (RQC) complex YloA/Tae2 family protein
MRYLKKFEGNKVKFPNVQKLNVDGFVVYLGKDSKSNDYMTFSILNSEDIWMHAKGVPGCHVGIKIEENLPTPELIKKVAEIAKKNSKAKEIENSTIVFCKRKFVKKVPGMNDGQVKVDYNNSNDIVI